MLKPMKPKQTTPNNLVLWILVGVLVVSGIVVLVISFGGGDDSADELNLVYTNAAATLAAQQAALLVTTPSATPTIFATPTNTVTPFASPTLFTAQILPTNTTGAVSGAVGCNNSVYVSDVTFPDDTVVTPGQKFTKTWKLQNTGSCPWTTAYKVSFVSGNAMGGVATPLTVTVAPGTSGDVSVAMTAPATAGDAIGYWILTSDTGQNFGTSFYIKVKVGGTTTTGTATVTATATTAASAPTAASNVAITLTCALGGTGGTQKEHAGTLTWTDNSTNETGFNIYINSVFAATVAPNTISFGVPAGVFYDTGVTSTYAVEAINGSLKAAQATVTVSCP